MAGVGVTLIQPQRYKTSAHTMKDNYCTQRSDLLEQGIRIPVGNLKVQLTLPIRYRWVGEDETDFEVNYNGEWLEAQSIDFEFEEEAIDNVFNTPPQD